MKMTRRDILKLAAGSAAGILFTPVPWKSMDDGAIWTQNWSWTPRPAAGESLFRQTACSLCPAGCGIRARCINGMPVSLSGIPGHLFGNGTLCAVGLAAHHLPFHPARARQPLRRVQKRGMVESTPITRTEALEALIRTVREQQSRGTIALLDQRPGRTLSALYRQWAAAQPRGLYVIPPPVEDGTIRTAGRLTGSEMGWDLEHASTILSIGTPLFEGWGTPGRMARLASMRSSAGAPVIIQAETRQSRTALAADRWLPLRPGSEAALVLGLCNILLRERLVPDPDAGHRAFCALASELTPEKAAEATGIPAATLEETARYLAAHRPAIVVAGGDPAAGPLHEAEQSAVVMLNALLGSIGTAGGAVPRTAINAFRQQTARARQEESILSVPDHSLAVLILDGAENGSVLPWEIIERKLMDNATVVSLSPFLAGLARRADLIIPAPVPLERWEDLPAPHDAPTASLAIASPLFTPPEGAVDPLEVVRALAQESGVALPAGSMEELLRQESALVYEAKSGLVHASPAPKAVRDLGSAAELFEMLAAGGVWTPDPGAQAASGQLRVTPLGEDQLAALRGFALAGSSAPAPDGARVTLLPFGLKAAAATGQLSPILSKLFQESGLYTASHQVLINPSTCAHFDLADGAAALVSSAAGSVCVTVRMDPAVMPGVVLAAVGPDPAALQRSEQDAPGILALCTTNECTWRTTAVTIGRA